MIFAEVGLNHNGSRSYASKYINFHKKTNFDILTFQIREPNFYKRKEKRHLKLPTTFYKNLSKIYKKKLFGDCGVSLSSIQTFNEIKSFKFNYYKILSMAANNEKLIKKILKETTSKIYISCGLMSFKELINIVNRYEKNKRIKFIYTQLSYKKSDLNLINFFYLSKKYPNKFAYGHHYTNKLPIYLIQSKENIDLFIYIKGDKKIRHPDEKHALNFKNFDRLLREIKDIKTLIGIKKNLSGKNTIPDQNR